MTYGKDMTYGMDGRDGAYGTDTPYGTDAAYGTDATHGDAAYAPGPGGYADGFPEDAVHLGGARFQSDPTALYRELRRDHGAVAPVRLDGGLPAWLVLGYRELHLVTADSALFSRDPARWNQWPRVPADWPLAPMIGRNQNSVLHTVGQHHRERAGVIAEALESVDPFVLKRYAEEYADDLIDGFCAFGRTELISQYATLLPVRVLARVYGFPDEEGPYIVKALNDLTDSGENALAGQRCLSESVAALVREKHVTGGHDVLSRMLRNPYGFTDEEVVQDLMVMMVAGHQPTADWIGNSLRLMFTDDRFTVSLSGGRHSVPEAMNEVLWEDTPSQNVAGRWATADTTLGNRRVHEGDMLILGVAAANYDPQVRTDSYTLTGGNNAFFSFGHGEHRCPFPAQEISEVVARAAIEVLLDRLPDIELAVPATSLNWRRSPWQRGLAALPVRYTPAPPYGRA
ncbi:cytochrome P450 [Streptomyces sp. NPDC093085]|uniref:cytochrome P450 n=1 Tax=Streptomyces sp. NPDC093085 TaxID=3155068 RepID=UPI003441683E